MIQLEGLGGKLTPAMEWFGQNYEKVLAAIEAGGGDDDPRLYSEYRRYLLDGHDDQAALLRAIDEFAERWRRRIV